MSSKSMSIYTRRFSRLFKLKIMRIHLAQRYPVVAVAKPLRDVKFVLHPNISRLVMCYLCCNSRYMNNVIRTWEGRPTGTLPIPTSMRYPQVGKEEDEKQAKRHG